MFEVTKKHYLNETITKSVRFTGKEAALAFAEREDADFVIDTTTREIVLDRRDWKHGYAVVVNGAVQNAYDAGLGGRAAAESHASRLAGYKPTHDILLDNGSWGKVASTVAVEELTYPWKPYESGKVVARWIAGSKVL